MNEAIVAGTSFIFRSLGQTRQCTLHYALMVECAFTCDKHLADRAIADTC